MGASPESQGQGERRGALKIPSGKKSPCPPDSAQGTALPQGKDIRNILLFHPSTHRGLCLGSWGSGVSEGHVWTQHSHTLSLPSSQTTGTLTNTALMPGECLPSLGWSCTGFIQALALLQPCPSPASAACAYFGRQAGP